DYSVDLRLERVGVLTDTEFHRDHGNSGRLRELYTRHTGRRCHRCQHDRVVTTAGHDVLALLLQRLRIEVCVEHLHGTARGSQGLLQTGLLSLLVVRVDVGDVGDLGRLVRLA